MCREESKCFGKSGEQKSCKKGIDYAQTCPIGWKYAPAGPQGPECQAPPNFYTESDWCRQQLTSRQVIPARLSEWERKELYDSCWMLWPCRDVKHDYRKPCPLGWTWEQDGTCSAPYFYRGTCPWNVNLLNYTRGMKATFAANCGVGWPLDARYEGPQPKPLPAKYPSHAPGRKPAWECVRNFIRPCPDSFNFDGAMCHEDGSYIGANMKNCAHFDARRWTNEMKEAFSAHCHVWWPCNQASGSAKRQTLRNGPVAQARLPLIPMESCLGTMRCSRRRKALRHFL
ncbi:unnamed protein product [Symbiodinium sp. KB8]|nr:unnamed protein product [Symbiodinium sp. KB8]